MAHEAVKFDKIFQIYSSLIEDSSRLYELDDAEIKLANDKEWRNNQPRAITLGFPHGRKWRVQQGNFKCLTEKYDFLPTPMHILACMSFKQKTILQICCKGSLWTWTSGLQISSYHYGTIEDVRAKVKELGDFYDKHYYIPAEAIEDSANVKKFFQRRRRAGDITKIYATRSQVINYGPLRHVCRETPRRRQFSLYHINDILKVIPIDDQMKLEDLEGIERSFSMKEAEKLTGVDRSTIKVWIKKYELLIKMEKNTYRFEYNDLKMLENLKGKSSEHKAYIIQMNK